MRTGVYSEREAILYATQFRRGRLILQTSENKFYSEIPM